MANSLRTVGALERTLEEQRERLMPCVHCGFCLPACPTYNRLGDEADSPRGRLHLMRAVVDGRMSPGSDGVPAAHRPLPGCRACEPVCPSGVEYGTLLELARDVAARSRPPAPATRLMLAVFSSQLWRRLFFRGGALLRATGLAALGARLIPPVGPLRSARFGLAMLAATRRWPGLRRWTGGAVGAPSHPESARGGRPGPATTQGSPSAALEIVTPPPAARRLRVGLLTGCVQEGLYARVNDATRRVLEANGYEVVEVEGQECCGALHAHGGALDEARRLARVNVASFEAAGVDLVAVNAAGCGAAMKEYGTYLSGEPTATWPSAPRPWRGRCAT